MLTPKFSLSQNADFLFITLHVPFIKFDLAECDTNQDEFYFSANPYYLRLHLPGNVVNDDRLKSKYDSEKGDLQITIPKEVPGRRFDGLDMLTNLLTPKQRKLVPNIEVVNPTEDTLHKNSSCENSSEAIDEQCSGESVEEFDWFIDQGEESSNDDKVKIDMKAPCYGFAHLKSNLISQICSEVDVIDLKDPDSVKSEDRSLLRRGQENEKFDVEHYLADLFEDESIKELIAIDYPHLTGCKDSKFEFTDAEKQRLMRLPKREYLIEKDKLPQVCLGLVDLVYAFSYNYRFCCGENGIESDWTICKLSSSLSWFDFYFNLKDVVISCARRTLCFPLYRNWNLFEKVLSDVKQIFAKGRRQILRCLLGIHSILEKSEGRYLLNELYITDYCVWIQSADKNVIRSLATSLSELHISKEDVGFSIVEIEEDAKKLMEDCTSDVEDDNNIQEISKKMVDVVRIADTVCSDDSDDDESSDSSSSYESESESDSSSSDSSTEDEEEVEEKKKETIVEEKERRKDESESG